MRIEIFSDVVCPWCYVGLARFDRALEAFEHADQVQVELRSFELDPAAPREGGPVVDALMAKFGSGRDQVLAMEQRVAGLAAAEGLGYTADRPAGNSFDAHRLLHLAAARGSQRALRSAIWQRHFAEGGSVFDPASLRAVAVGAGLPADEVDDVLAGDRYATEVRADEQRAAAIGVSGVPFFVLGDVDGGKGAQVFGLSGAQPLQTFTAALGQAWEAAVAVGG